MVTEKKSGTHTGSNMPEDTGVNINMFVKAFNAEGTAEGKLITAQGNTSRTALQFASNPANAELLDTMSTNWNLWNVKGTDKASVDRRQKGQNYFCDTFGIGEQPKNDKGAAADWRNDIKRLKPYVEMTIAVHRHGWAHCFTFNDKGGTFIKRDSELGKQVWDKYEWNKKTDLAQLGEDHLIQIINRKDLAFGAMLSWSMLREDFTHAAIAGSDRTITGDVPAGNGATDAVIDFAKRPDDGVKVLVNDMLKPENRTLYGQTTIKKVECLISAQGLIELAFPAYSNPVIWDLFGKAFAEAHKLVHSTYVAPKGTPPVGTAEQIAAATAKMERMLDKNADQRTQDKPATSVPHPGNGKKAA